MNKTFSHSSNAEQLQEQENCQLSLPSQHHLVVWLNNLSVQETNDSSEVLPEDGEGLIHLRNCSERIKLILSLIKVPELGNVLSPPLKRKLLFLSRCNLTDCDERLKAMRTAISIGNRIIVEFIVKYTDPHQIISNLWNAVRNRGCQFLGPAIQEEILKLVLLALEDGNELTRKVLIMFVMQRLLPHFPCQASKTSIGHVIQILYRASCFDVIKREGDSSLMQLKPEFRNYESLRREHDTQIISISMEAGLRISPEQWSSLLYGDNRHKSHMQSIIDKLQTIKLSSDKLINKLKSILSKTDDPGKIMDVMTYFEQLAYFETHLSIQSNENVCSLENVSVAIDAVNFIIIKFITFLRFIYQKPITESTNN